jgi:1-acyl-sn-glycerol-3-phosphate acyltransferase
MRKWFFKATNHYLSKAFSKVCFPVTAYGLENYPDESEAVLLALNHESKADSFLILLILEEYFGKQIDLRAYVTASHMDTWYGGWLRGQDMYRVERGRGFEQLEEGMDFLRNGGHLAIFPEARMRRGRRFEPKKGVAYIAHHTKVPILPIHIEYIPSRYFWYRRCIITIGTKIQPQVSSLDDYQGFAQRVMSIVDELPEKRKEYTQIAYHS